VDEESAMTADPHAKARDGADARRGASPGAVLAACFAGGIFIALLLICGCASPGRPRRPLVVAASIHPLGALAEEIAGSDASVLVLLPPGANPHSFEPTPKAVAAGSEASVVVLVGAGLDDWARPIVHDAVARGAPEIVASSLIDSLLPAVPDEDNDPSGHPGASGAEHGGEPAHGLVDPHVWLDPIQLIPTCRGIGSTLASLDPQQAQAYRRRAAACEDSLRALDRQLAAILAPVRGVPFVAVHNAWSYLCRRYGLRQAEVIQRVATHEPGPRGMVEVMRGAAAAGARAVFTEVQSSTATAQTMASELGLRVALLDPEGAAQDPARHRYFDLMRWNAVRIREALSP
jgi:zinc transport system substrate-binding protein